VRYRVQPFGDSAEAGRRRPQLTPTNPGRSHLGARIWVAEWLQRGSRGVSPRARGPRFPCKSVVDRRGVEPLTSAVQRPKIQSCIVTPSPKKSLISREIVRALSRGIPTQPNENRAFGLQKACRTSRAHSHREVPPLGCQMSCVAALSIRHAPSRR